MTFSVDDYEKAITRIFDAQGHVVGTGFLVAPGYVMTCAHVVLQAIGVDFDSEQYDFAVVPVGAIITLDFPMADKRDPIKAEVLSSWRPYRIDRDDIATLKLLAAASQQSKPMPIIHCVCADIQAQRHAVYGFANDNGDRTDAYRPKSNAPGGRFQLCKSGNDPIDETIEAGFSGAPVWNYDRGGVIGMVATAALSKDQRSKAYAISAQEMQSVLNEIESFCLDDVLTQSLADCSSEDDKHQLNITIAAALLRCNPTGDDRSRREQLVDLNIDRAPVTGWETEGRLVHFAMILAWMGDTSVSERLEAWINRCDFSFSHLFVRIDREMKQKKISSSNICQHLMVVVDPRETAPNELRVSLWAVPDRATYDPRNPSTPIVSEKILAIGDLPGFIREQIRQKFRKVPTPTIHLFVPRSLFGCDVEMLPSNKFGAILGSEYPFVIRTNLKTFPIGYYYYDDWNEKWKQIETAFEHKTRDVFQPVDCSLSDADLVAQFTSITAAILQECDSVADLFELISEETALPVALWSRDPQFQANLTDVLDCIVEKLHDRVRQERDTARRSISEKLLGHHLSLVWEDPKIVPPDMQFDPEAC